MILLDTNVVSETMTPGPHPAVQRWFNAQAEETLYLSSVTVAELWFGVRCLPASRRKANLTATLVDVLNLFSDRILPFDTRAAETYSDLAVHARAAERGFPIPDGYIAAIAAARGFAVASQDATAFAAVGLTVINPWTDE